MKTFSIALLLTALSFGSFAQQPVVVTKKTVAKKKTEHVSTKKTTSPTSEGSSKNVSKKVETSTVKGANGDTKTTTKTATKTKKNS
ncbi:hypothetical protein [Siphonobacter curvatus]|uniref:Uncharacterized protein n=1 Tax=Siphonobacter curvatus TaxID=2094562 RepID=A0A2S7IS84_9BACT|nr:hypothetical protein [Siphonobacter curvatus]PQA60542.1 hypothetical protein C5O19_13265 [Siphonobacter curvatus]